MIDQAHGKHLEMIAKQCGIEPVENETETSLRKRAIASVLGESIPGAVVSESRPARWWLTFIWTWQADLLGLIAVLFIRFLWGSALFWRDGLWVELDPRSWFVRTWYSKWLGTTFSHGGMVAKGRKALRHELHHVEQFESRMLSGFLLGLVSMIVALAYGSPILHCVIALEIQWFGAWLVGYFASLAQAYLRGEDPYLGSHLEEAAYALADDELEEMERGSR